MRIIRLIDYSNNTKMFAVSYMRQKRPKGWIGYKISTKREYNVFIYIHSGCVEFKNRAGERTVCTDDMIMFIPKGSACESVYIAEYTEISAVNFRLEDEGEEATFSDCLEVMPAEHAVRYKRFFLAFEDIPKHINTALHHTRSLCSLLAEMNIENFTSEEKNGFELIATGVEVLIDRFKENIPISEIARFSMISESYFRRIFKQFYGRSPVEFRNQLRVNFANDLHASGLYTKAEAARAAGIENANYFSRLNTKFENEKKKARKEKER